MAMAHHALMARLGLETRMLCEKLSNLRLDRLGQQRTRAAAQDLCQGVGEDPWLGELDDATVGHGVSLLHWRSGGVEHHHDTPPYPVSPSPTSGHSSERVAGWQLFRTPSVVTGASSGPDPSNGGKRRQLARMQRFQSRPELYRPILATCRARRPPCANR